MNNRRSFLKQTAGIAGTMSLASFMDPLFAGEMEKQVEKISNLSPAEAATNEDFWGFKLE